MFTGCASVSKTSNTPSTLVQKSWELVTLEGQDITTSAPVYLTLDKDNKVTGNAGCYTLNGNFNIANGTQIRFTQLATTRMMCAPYDMNIEKEVLEVLKAADNFTMSDGKLMLNVGRRAPLAVFVEMSKKPVVNKYWTLTQMNGKPVQMAANQEKAQGFMLSSNGKITGFAGCNNFFGTYNLSEKDGINVADNIGMTMKACLDVKIDEQGFTNLFRKAKRYEVKGKTLTLKDSKGQQLALFEAM